MATRPCIIVYNMQSLASTLLWYRDLQPKVRLHLTDTVIGRAVFKGPANGPLLYHFNFMRVCLCTGSTQCCGRTMVLYMHPNGHQPSDLLAFELILFIYVY